MDAQYDVGAVFTETFGRTPLTQRLDDVFGEAVELKRFTDLANLKEEAGDLLCSTLQLCNECGWDADQLVRDTLEKIRRRSVQYQSLGRKTSVAILGGAFDPPTRGHMRLAKYVLDVSRAFDEVWLMPCWQHMYGKDMTPAEDRLQMVADICKHDGRVKPFDFEIANKLSGESYQTIKLLLERDFAKHQFDFSWIIGMDNANMFHKWVNYEHLEKMIRFVVVPREGIVRDESVDWYLSPPHIFLGNPETNIGEVSSTQVRELARCGIHGVGEYVYPETEQYIVDHGLYK